MLPGTGQDQSVLQNQTEEGDARFLQLRMWNVVWRCGYHHIHGRIGLYRSV